MPDEWDQLMEIDTQVSAEAEADEVESACKCRSQSDSETDSESPGPISRLSLWWARSLYRVVVSLGWQWPNFRELTVQLISGCTGCSAECAALKASQRQH